VKDAKNIILKVKGKGWTARISMDDDTVQHVGIQIMLLRIAGAVTNILAPTPQSLTPSPCNISVKPGMTGYIAGTMKSSSTLNQTWKKCTSTTKPS